MKWTAEQIIKIQRIAFETDVQSLNAKCNVRSTDPVETETEIGDFVVDERNPFDELERNIRNGELRKLIKQLNDPRAERILYLRYGLDGGDYKTLDEIGNMYGVTRERVRQLESKALEKLTKLVKQQGLKYEDFE